MQWIFVLCGRMFLLSLIATYQVCTVSLKAGLYTYKHSGADVLQLTLVPRFSFRARLTAGVRCCAYSCEGSSVPWRRARSRTDQHLKGRFS
jgi:hypothetical protein